MFRQVLMTTGTRLVNAVISIVMVILSARWMGAGEYGVAGIILLDVTVIAMVNEFFGGSSLVYFAPRVSMWRLLIPSYIWAGMVIVLAVIVWGVLSFFPLLVHAVIPEGYALHILVISLMVSLAGIHQNLLLGKGEVAAYNKVFFLQIIMQLTGLVFMLFIIKVRDAHAWVIALYCGYGFSWMLGLLYTRKWIKPEVLTGWKKLLHEIFSFGSQSQMASAIHLANKRLSFYIISPVLGSASLGVYNAGAQLTEGLRIVGQSISLVQFSHISNSNDVIHNRTITLLLLKFTVIVTLLGVLVLAVIPPSVFAMLLGAEFSKIRPVVLALGLGVVALAATMIFSHYFSGTGQPKYNLHASLAGLVITLIFIYPAVFYWGITGAGIIASLAYFVSSLYQAIVFCRLSGCSFSDFWISRKDFEMMKSLVSDFLRR